MPQPAKPYVPELSSETVLEAVRDAIREVMIDSHASTTADMMTEKEAAALLRIGERTIRRWRADGDVPYYRLPGGSIRYSRESLHRWLYRNCPRPRNPESRIQ
jgi:excisionase family DNA binding protein